MSLFELFKMNNSSVLHLYDDDDVIWIYVYIATVFCFGFTIWLCLFAKFMPCEWKMARKC